MKNRISFAWILIIFSLYKHNNNGYSVKGKFQDDGKCQNDFNGTLTILRALLGPKVEGKCIGM